MYLIHLSENAYPMDLGALTTPVAKPFPEMEGRHLFCGNSKLRFNFNGFLLKLMLLLRYLDEQKGKKGEDFCFIVDGPLSLHVLSVLKEAVGTGMNAAILNSLLLYSHEISRDVYTGMLWKKRVVSLGVRKLLMVVVPRVFFGAGATAVATTEETCKLWREKLLEVVEHGLYTADMFTKTIPFDPPSVPLNEKDGLLRANKLVTTLPSFIPLFYNIKGGSMEISGRTYNEPHKKIVLTLGIPGEAFRCHYLQSDSVRKKARSDNWGKGKPGAEKQDVLLDLDKFMVLNIPENTPELSVGRPLLVQSAVYVSKKDRTDNLFFNSGLDPVWRTQLAKSWKIGCNFMRDPKELYTYEEVMKRLLVHEIFISDPTQSLEDERVLTDKFLPADCFPDVILFFGTLWQLTQLRLHLIHWPQCLVINLREHGVTSVKGIRDHLRKKRPLENLLALALECRLGSLDQYPLSDTKMVMAAYLHQAQLLHPNKIVLVPHPAHIGDQELAEGDAEEVAQEDAFSEDHGMYSDDDTASTHSLMTSAIRETEEHEKTGGLVFRDERDIGFHGEAVIEFDFRAFYPSIIIAYDISLDDQGIMSTVLAALLKRRLELKRKDPFSPEQEGLKLLLNKFYGTMCRHNRPLGLKVTEKGRYLISKARDKINRSKLGRVLYIDSDSLFVARRADKDLDLAEWQGKVIELVETSLMDEGLSSSLRKYGKPYRLEVKKVLAGLVLCLRKKAYFGLDSATGTLVTSSLEDSRSDWSPEASRYLHELLDALYSVLKEGDCEDKKFRSLLVKMLVESLQRQWGVLTELSDRRVARFHSKARAIESTRVWPCASYTADTAKNDARTIIPRAALRKFFVNGDLCEKMNILPYFVSQENGGTGRTVWNISALAEDKGEETQIDRRFLFTEHYIGPVSHVLCSLVTSWDAVTCRNYLCEKVYGK